MSRTPFQSTGNEDTFWCASVACDSAHQYLYGAEETSPGSGETTKSDTPAQATEAVLLRTLWWCTTSASADTCRKQYKDQKTMLLQEDYAAAG